MISIVVPFHSSRRKVLFSKRPEHQRRSKLKVRALTRENHTGFFVSQILSRHRFLHEQFQSTKSYREALALATKYTESKETREHMLAFFSEGIVSF